MSGKCGEDRIRAMLLVAGLGKRRANPPDGLTNGLGGLACLIHRAVVDVAAAPGPAEPGLCLQPSKSSCSNYLAKCLRLGCSCTEMAPSV